jgi:D-lactate dehydrogenase
MLRRSRSSSTCAALPNVEGFRRAHGVAIKRAVERLWIWSNEGARPVVIDTSPCGLTLKRARPALDAANRRRFDSLEILDGIEFALRLLDGGLKPSPTEDPIVLHPVCSVHKMELLESFESVAKACSRRVVVPRSAGCCGFAGDRGFLFPELTASALRKEAAELTAVDYAGYYSSSRTCELGLIRATGKPYRSFWALLDETTSDPSSR